MREFIYGNKNRGYAIRQKGKIYESQIWYDGEILRTDDFNSRKEALKWIRYRRRTFLTEEAKKKDYYKR